MRQTKESSYNQFYNYITRDDLLNIFGNDVVLTIKNYDTKSLSDYTMDGSGEKEARSVRFRSIWKGIDVRLVTNNGETLRKTNTSSSDGENGTYDDVASSSESSKPTDPSDDEQEIDGKRDPGLSLMNNNARKDMKRNGDGSKAVVEDDVERRDAARALLHFALKNKCKVKSRRDLCEGMRYIS